MMVGMMMGAVVMVCSEHQFGRGILYAKFSAGVNASLACEAGDSVKPGVERSGTPGSIPKYVEPAERASAGTGFMISVVLFVDSISRQSNC